MRMLWILQSCCRRNNMLCRNARRFVVCTTPRYIRRSINLTFSLSRFDLYLPKFMCTNCNKLTKPSFQDCAASGFWPGTPEGITVLFDPKALHFWNNLRLLTHHTFGTSESKFIECLSALSFQAGRNPVIDKKHFNEASKVYHYTHHLVDKRIKQMDKTVCRACIDFKTGKPNALVCHIDGNFKLLKYSIDTE